MRIAHRLRSSDLTAVSRTARTLRSCRTGTLAACAALIKVTTSWRRRRRRCRCQRTFRLTGGIQLRPAAAKIRWTSAATCAGIAIKRPTTARHSGARTTASHRDQRIGTSLFGSPIKVSRSARRRYYGAASGGIRLALGSIQGKARRTTAAGRSIRTVGQVTGTAPTGIETTALTRLCGGVTSLARATPGALAGVITKVARRTRVWRDHAFSAGQSGSGRATVRRRVRSSSDTLSA